MSHDRRRTEVFGFERGPNGSRDSNPEEGSGAGAASSQNQITANEELPEEELDSMEARKFGERLCEKTASDWSAAQLDDETARAAVERILVKVPIEDMSEEAIPDTVDKKEVNG